MSFTQISFWVLFQGQVVWGSEQPGVVEGVPAHYRGVEWDELQDYLQHKPLYDSVEFLC